MTEIVDIGDVNPGNNNQNPVKQIWQVFQGLDRFTKLFFITGIILVASTPIIANTVLTTRNFAAQEEGGVATSVGINPDPVVAKVGGQSVSLSAVILDANNSPLALDIITYEWQLAPVSLGALSKTDGKTVEFFPQKAGFGEIHLTAREGSITFSRSIKIVVEDKNGNMPPSPTPTISPTPVPVQSVLSCPTNISSTSQNGKYITVHLESDTGIPLADKKITWKIKDLAKYPLLSPVISNTNSNAQATTYVWIPENFDQEVDTIVKVDFAGDKQSSPATCEINVSFDSNAGAK